MIARLFLVLFLVSSPAAPAQEIHPFVRGSLAGIVAARANVPFVLGFWSLTCAHCQEELALFGRMVKDDARFPLVLVSTDTPADQEAINAVLARHGLTAVENWVFADDFVERLRFEVDPRWHGELPRTYVYRGGRAVHSASGVVQEQTLRAWLSAGGLP